MASVLHGYDAVNVEHILGLVLSLQTNPVLRQVNEINGLQQFLKTLSRGQAFII